VQYENIRVTLGTLGSTEGGDGFERITGLDHGLLLTESGSRLKGFLVDLYGDLPLVKDSSFVETCTAPLFIQALDVDETGNTRLKPGTRGELKEVIADFLLGWLFTGGIEKELWIEQVFSAVDLLKRDWVVWMWFNSQELILVYMYKLESVFQSQGRLTPILHTVCTILGLLFWNGGPCEDERRLLEVCGKSTMVLRLFC
jgi:hypothetical protein